MLFPGLKQLLCLVSASNMSSQHLQQYVQIQAAALMTMILGCGAATIQGQLLYEPQLLTGQIRCRQPLLFLNYTLAIPLLHFFSFDP